MLILEEPPDFSALVGVQAGLILHLASALLVLAGTELDFAVLIFLGTACRSRALQDHTSNDIDFIVGKLGVRSFSEDVGFLQTFGTRTTRAMRMMTGGVSGAEGASHLRVTGELKGMRRNGSGGGVDGALQRIGAQSGGRRHRGGRERTSARTGTHAAGFGGTAAGWGGGHLTPTTAALDA